MRAISDAPTTIQLHHDLALELSREERLRLLIRVMCELVAYGEDDTADIGRRPSTPNSSATVASSG